MTSDALFASSSGASVCFLALFIIRALWHTTARTTGVVSIVGVTNPHPSSDVNCVGFGAAKGVSRKNVGSATLIFAALV